VRRSLKFDRVNLPDMVEPTLMLDADNTFLGIYGTPQVGGYYWYSAADEGGQCNSSSEAEGFILDSLGEGK
jgi:hypothetical protein